VLEKEKQAASQAKVAEIAAAREAAPPAQVKGQATPTVKVRKLNNRERRELETLPAKIETLETEQLGLTAKLSDPVFYKNEAAKFAEVKTRLEVIEREHASAFSRWEELDGAE